jgi:hypothetical protein
MTVLVAALLPAQAGKGHGKKHHKHGHRSHPFDVQRVYVGERRGDLVIAPGAIVAHDLVRYRPFHRGDYWFEPHRHVHAVYEFPVRSDYGIDYRQASYCNGERFTSSYVSYDGPRFHVRVRF